MAELVLITLTEQRHKEEDKRFILINTQYIQGIYRTINDGATCVDMSNGDSYIVEETPIQIIAKILDVSIITKADIPKEG